MLSGLLFTGCKTGETISSEEKIAQIANSIGETKYTFVPATAIPMGAPSISLTPSFFLKIRKDTIDAYLPYYGRAYTAPIDPSKGPFTFTSTDFEYKISQNKKGEWDVDIQTNDTDGKTKLSLSVDKSGSASLSTSNNNRQPISFYGSVEPK